MAKREFDPISSKRNGKLQNLVEHCLELYDEFKDSKYHEAKIQSNIEARKTYEQVAEKAEFPWSGASNVVLPMETISIDNLEPRLVAGLIGKSPLVNFSMEGMTEQDEPTRILEDWFNDELVNTVEIEKIGRSGTHDLLLEGTKFFIPEYRTDEELRRDFVYDEQGQMIIGEGNLPATEDQSQLVFDGVRIESIKFNDIFIPDDAEDWEKTPVIRKIAPTYGDLMRHQEDNGYMNIGPWLVEDEDDGTIKEEDQSPAQTVDDVSVKGKKTIDCIECYISYVYKEEDQEDKDVTDWTEERVIATIALNKEVLIRIRLLRDVRFTNKHLIRRQRLYPERGMSYGSNIHAKMKSIQEGASNMFNLVVNSGTIEIIPWFLYGNKAGLEGDVKLAPGVGVPVDDPSAVVFPKFNNLPSTYGITFIEMFNDFWERLVSITDAQIGRQGEKDTTATEFLGIVQEGNIKHNYQTRTYREEFIELLRTVYDLYYQNMPVEKSFNFQGQDVPIPRKAMKRDVRFKLTGSTEMANKLIKRKEAEDKMMVLGQNPNVNPIKPLEEYLQTHDPDVNLKEWIIPMIGQVIAAIQENPEIPEQVIMPYIQSKMKIAQEIGQPMKGNNAGTSSK